MTLKTLVIVVVVAYLLEQIGKAVIDLWFRQPPEPYVPPPPQPKTELTRNSEGSGYEDIAMRDQE